MKQVVPDYFGEFSCLMGACRHSCCIGWEIDIDEEKLSFYRDVSVEIGKRLRENISVEGETAHFRLGAGERCPFLNSEGLCDLIIQLGEGALCQICADHPRFRNFYSDREETGLGLCCEAAARLILNRVEKVSFLEEGAETLDEDESELIALRDEMIRMAQDREISVERRLDAILEWDQLDLGEIDWRGWAGFLGGLERLDEAWDNKLALLEGGAVPGEAEAWEPAFEQLLVYLIWRHLPGALEDDDISGRIAFVALMWRMLRRMFACGDMRMEELEELARLYSSEIEYSDENIYAILDQLHALYPEL